MILFIGDFVRLHESKQWLEVTDIEPHDICVLQNGDRVCASAEYIAEAKSKIEYAGTRVSATGFKFLQKQLAPSGHKGKARTPTHLIVGLAVETHQ